MTRIENAVYIIVMVVVVIAVLVLCALVADMLDIAETGLASERSCAYYNIPDGAEIIGTDVHAFQFDNLIVELDGREFVVEAQILYDDNCE